MVYGNPAGDSMVYGNPVGDSMILPNPVGAGLSRDRARRGRGKGACHRLFNPFANRSPPSWITATSATSMAITVSMIWLSNRWYPYR